MNAQQLKNAILQEAIEGRLVPQDPNDEPASVLLERIRAEKERLVKEGKIKKDKNDSYIYRSEDGHWMEHFSDKKRGDICIDDQIPFEIPDNWSYVRWGMLGDYKKGPFGSSLTKSMFVPKTKETIKVYEQKNAIKKDFSIGDYYITPSKYEEMKGFTVGGGDIIVSCAGTIGETYLLPSDAPVGIINQALMRARLYDANLSDYWMLYFQYILIIENKLKGSGTAIKNIPPFEELKAMLLAIPPYEEQRRILKQISSLNEKATEFGKAQEELNKLNEELPEKLKKSILQEAIEGRLVPQDPNDEPASVLLEKIREEKKRLVKEGKLKKKDLEEKPISEDEIPYEIPDNWKWCRLGDIGIFERGNGIKRDETFESGYPCVRYGEMYTKYKYAPTFEKTISFTSKSVFDKCRKAHKGDLFMALTGENKQDISLAAQYVGEEEIAMGGDLCHFTILKAFQLYFVYLINSTYFSGKKELLATGDIIVHISTDKLASIPIPLPPFAEQKRIVAKIEELFQKIEGLKQ